MVMPLPPGTAGGVQATLTLVLEAGFILSMTVGADETLQR